MRKSFTLGLWVFLTGCTLPFSFALAGPITPSRAKEIALQQRAQVNMLRGEKAPLQLSYTSEGPATRGSSVDDATYYVFTGGAQEFYIVSGDDQTEEILGYSTHAAFDAANLPPQLKYWLDLCDRVVSQVRKGNVSYEHSTRNSAPPVAPLLQGIIWNQGDPYNLYTPLVNGERTPTGCVATALGQIMRFHSWPPKGKGSVMYTQQSTNLPLSHTLGKKYYEWGDMLPSLGLFSPKKSKEAVAYLLQEVGAACHMQYSAYGSGAYSSQATMAMLKNFSYSRDIQFLSRDYFPREKWESIILNELQNKRPLYYAGAATEGGHAFVCDGYDGRGYFHINWGWGGMGNGYFSLLGLNPDAQGIGHGGAGGYIIGQEIIIGLKSNEGEAEDKPLTINVICDSVKCDDAENIVMPAKIDVKTSLFSLTPGEITLNTGIDLRDKDGKSIKIYSTAQRRGFNGIYRGYFNIKTEVTLDNVPEGEYTLHPVVQRENSSEWIDVHMLDGTPDRVIITVTGINVSVKNSRDEATAMVAKLISENVATASPSHVKVRLINNHPEKEYYHLVGIRILQDSNKKQVDSLQMLSSYTPLMLAPGDSTELKFTFMFPDTITNSAFLQVLYDKDNGYSNFKPENGDYYPRHTLAIFPLNLKERRDLKEGKPFCELIEYDTLVKVGERLNFKARLYIPEDAAGYSGRITGFLFKENAEETSGYFSPQYSIIESGQSDTLEFSKAMYLPEGKYEVVVAFYNYHDSIFNSAKFDSIAQKTNPNFRSFFAFRMTGEVEAPEAREHPREEEPTAVEDNPLAGTTLAPNPCRDKIRVHVPQDNTNLLVRIYSTQGILVREMKAQEPDIELFTGDLPSGLYLLQIQDGKHSITKRFIVL